MVYRRRMPAMINIGCDECKRTFSVEADLGGSEVVCPTCSRSLRVSESKDGNETEKELWVAHPVMFRARPVAFFGMLLLIFGGAGITVWAWWNSLALEGWVGAGCTTAGLIWWGVWWLVRLTETIRVTNQRTIHRIGLLRRATSEVLHDHVRNLRISQSFWQRVVQTGSLVIDSAAGERDAEITVENISRPDAIKEIIDRYRS